MLQAPKPRKSWTDQIKAVIHFYHARTGMRYTTIGRHAMKNPHMWGRLQNGGTITLDNADKVIDWMAAQGFHLTPEGEPYAEEKTDAGR